MGFSGGYRFKHFEGPAEPVLTTLGLPDTVVYPISDGFTVTVAQDDTVSAGTPVLRHPERTGMMVLSSVNGTVKSHDGNRIVISADGSDSFQPIEGHTREPWRLDHGDVVNLACRTGFLPLLGGAYCDAEICASVRHIIVNTVHNAPLDQKWTPEICNDAALTVAGLQSLKALFPNADITITANARNEKVLSGIINNGSAVIKVLDNNYPQEHPELLCRDALDARLVRKDGTYDPSIITMSYEMLVQFAEGMTLGRPLIDRIAMVAGPGVSRPGWYRIRTGTLFNFIADKLFKAPKNDQHWRIVRNGLLTGSAVDGDDYFSAGDSEIAVIREIEVRELWRFMNPGFDYDAYSLATAAKFLPFILRRLDTGMHGGERPCVQCNFCDTVCPAGIYPFLIWKLAGVDKIEETYRLRAYDCVGCGLCDYVCPSKISLSATVSQARKEYYESGSVDESTD